MLATILVGSSGSGKSTHAKTLGKVICSTDKYVEEQASILGVSYDNAFKVSQSTGIFKKFTKYFYEDMEYCIRNDRDFVIDRTNLGSEMRFSLILKLRKMAKNIMCKRRLPVAISKKLKIKRPSESISH